MTPDKLDRDKMVDAGENQEPMFTLNTQDRHGIVVVGDLPIAKGNWSRIWKVRDYLQH